MAETAQTRQATLSRSSDHLGSLATTLRDLAGPTTVLHELTQNADDAGNATVIRFTVTDEALVVWNDGTFTDCGAQRERRTCPWRESRSAACDLHAFRLFAGRNKAHDSSTTGAFGVGFTSVYQLTDHPELLTGEWHWILDESAAEDERIRICQDLNCRRQHGDSGTTFILPWARELTTLRQELGVQPVSRATIESLESALLREASTTLLFLKHVRSVEVGTRSEHRTFTRSDETLGPVISDGATHHPWLVLRASFGGDSQDIIDRAAGLIEPDRGPDVAIAIPMGEGAIKGVLYAGLPTQSASGLLGHINASFFPRTDRKGVRFDADVESEWNRAAIRAAGRVLSENVEVVVSSIGVKPFWELLVEVENLRQRVTKGEQDSAFLAFPTYLSEVVPHLAVLETIARTRVCPADSVLPGPTELYDDASVLTRLDLKVVSQDLHALVHRTRFTDYDVQLLTAKHIVEQLRAKGLTEPFDMGHGPLRREDNVALLRTFARFKSRVEIPDVEGMGDVAIIPCRNGSVAPASQTIVAVDDAEADLFELLADGALVADAALVNELCPSLLTLCTPVSVDLAADLLSDVDTSSLQSLSGDLLEWLDNRSGQIGPANRDRLARLPIYPSADGSFRPLTKLSLRSGFKDPLGIADLVHDETVHGHTDLLRKLGARELNVVEYLQRHVAPLAIAASLQFERVPELLEVISSSRAEIETAGARTGLSEVPIVPCEDGDLHPPSTAHFPSPEIRTIAPTSPIALIDGLPSHVVDTLEWLGVSPLPTLTIVARAARRIAEGPDDPDPGVAEAILRTIHAQCDESGSIPPVLQPLSEYTWLPVVRGGRARPSSVYPTNQRHLYGRQGRELGLSAGVQTRLFATLR